MHGPKIAMKRRKGEENIAALAATASACGGGKDPLAADAAAQC